VRPFARGNIPPMTCPNCRQDVPAAPFCVRCGEPLENAASPYPHEGRGYAAEPYERWAAPRIISSLFPHLTHAHMRAFRGALALGTLVVVLFAFLDLFPLALVVSAVLVPLLTVLYLVDVDLYEDKPWPMLSFTIGWGGLTGLGIGLVSRAIVRGDPSLATGDRGHALIWLGVVLPLASVFLMLLGPLILLPYRKFNDVLDGTTFGASCAVTFLGAKILASSADYLGSGVKVNGSAAPWVARLLTLAVAMPVLTAATIGAAAGTLWLRYRAPVGDRNALGLAGTPLVAIPAAAAVLVGAAISQIYLSRWVTLVLLFVAAAAALVALRRIVHLGLREEASEKPIGPPFTCPNCGGETPRHTFCSNCGISLQALPKAPPPAPAERPTPARGQRSPRFRRHVFLLLFGGALASVVGVALVWILLVEQGSPSPPCPPGRPCSNPPLPQPSAERPPRRSRSARQAGPYLAGRRWASRVGATLRFNPAVWSVLREDPDELQLLVTNDDEEHLWVTVRAVPANEMSALELLQDQVGREERAKLGVELDSALSHELLEPSIGFVAGIGAAYSGTLDATSPYSGVQFLLESATRGATTVLVEAMTDSGPQTPDNGASSPYPIFLTAATLLTTFTWPGTVAR
jgi:hypothetical protein